MLKEKKKVSKTVSISKLKKRITELNSCVDKWWGNYRGIRDKLTEIERLFPKRYYKVTFKAKATDLMIRQFEEIHLEIHAYLAVQKAMGKSSEFTLVCVEEMTT